MSEELTQEQQIAIEMLTQAKEAELAERVSQVSYWFKRDETGIVPDDAATGYAYFGTVALVRCARGAAALRALLAAYEERGREALRFYRADGSFEILGSAAEVVEHRKACAKELVDRWNALDAMRQRAEAAEAKLAALAPGGPRVPDNSMVICPNCTHQFPAISVDDQKERASLRQQLEAAQALLREARTVIANSMEAEVARGWSPDSAEHALLDKIDAGGQP